MSNSALVTYTKLSPNCNKPRNHKIDTVSIHCTAGQGTAKQILSLSQFVNYDSKNGMSCNYCVGKDGSIGLCVEEANRSWCTTSRANDHRAVTIEVSSDAKPPYAVTSQAYAALLDLLTDICRRNGIAKLVWSTNKDDRVGHKNGCNMTVHRDYAAKACPGEWLYSRHGQIAAEVNRRLGAAQTTGQSLSLKVGDEVDFIGTAHYPSANATNPATCKPGRAKVAQIYNGKHPYQLIHVAGGGSTVYGWVDAADIKL